MSTRHYAIIAAVIIILVELFVHPVVNVIGGLISGNTNSPPFRPAISDFSRPAQIIVSLLEVISIMYLTRVSYKTSSNNINLDFVARLVLTLCSVASLLTFLIILFFRPSV